MDTPTTQEQYAGLWLRIIAGSIDAVIYLIVTGILFTGLASGAGPVACIAVSAIGLVAYCACESSRWQGTPGKRLAGIAVTDLSGSRISFFRACGRGVVRVISMVVFGIGIIMIACNSKKQALHDKVARTLVVKTKTLSKNKMVFLSIVASCILLLLVASVLWIWFMILITPYMGIEV